MGLSYAQAISVVAQIETELTTIEQQQRALKRVGDLLQKARDAENLLASLDHEKQVREVSLIELESRYVSRNAVLHNESQSYLASLKAEESTAREKIQTIRNELAGLESSLVERERTVQSQLTRWNDQIKVKQEELTKVVEAFENFKKQYNL